jgi:hypothetical protein
MARGVHFEEEQQYTQASLFTNTTLIDIFRKRRLKRVIKELMVQLEMMKV